VTPGTLDNDELKHDGYRTMGRRDGVAAVRARLSLLFLGPRFAPPREAGSGARGRLSCGSRFGTSHAGSLGDCQRSSVPSSLDAVRNLTPDLASAHIAARAVRQTHHPRAPARNSASRTNRCGRLHLPHRDFSSMAIDFPSYQTSTSGNAGLDTALLAHRTALRGGRDRGRSPSQT
jgi:hypothetical protein